VISLSSAYLQGKTDKYNLYSNFTGITEGTEVLTSTFAVDAWVTEPEDLVDWRQSSIVQRMMTALAVFVEERDWTFSHRPRNLMLGMISEVGELAALLRWNGDAPHCLTQLELDKIAQELGDISIFWLRISHLYLSKTL
jgi:NTP pyrophosphatase (non-canonical NTP hydrolase)